MGLGADIRICHPDARLSMMEAKWGLVPDMGGVALMRELMPLDRAKELTLTGRILDAETAAAWGLVTEISAEPEHQAKNLIAEIRSRSPDAVAGGKFLLQKAWRAGDGAALRYERLWQRRIMGKRNQRIAVKRNQQQKEIPFYNRRLG